ncbi:MAG: S-methyl-5'-thioadenosine phosphorylase [Bacteroidales bacterium]|nr:MAG: S-methyl-5'-thioadenosine phosphorylase [Bacteroidales bacterium]
MIKVGIIGGSGLEDPDLIKNPETRVWKTPYGDPSSGLTLGVIRGIDVVLLSRHGKDHGIPPSKVNNRANIYALKDAGCTHFITTTACGSLREEIGRGDLVVPDQFIDFTRHRAVSFYESFEEGDLKHAAMADPFSDTLRQSIIKAAMRLKLTLHHKGTIITIEGPRFSTRAESKMFRAWGADLINMSIAPEAILANEIGIPYATIAMSTDYDSWKEDEDPVTWEEVLKIFRHNVGNVINLILEALPLIR